MDRFPAGSRKNIRTLTDRLKISEETAYAMILMEAMLTDLSADDERIVEMILRDSGNVEESKSESMQD